MSSFVCFNLVVVPALRKMSGWAQPQLRRVQVVTTSALKLDPERPEYHRVVLQYGRYEDLIHYSRVLGHSHSDWCWWNACWSLALYSFTRLPTDICCITQPRATMGTRRFVYHLRWHICAAASCCCDCRVPDCCGAAAGQLGWFATTTGNQISSRLLSARSANALLELPRAEGVIEAGTTVSALLIDDLGNMPQEAGHIPATQGFE